MEDINWDRIDKKKFFTQGAGLFSGVTTLLFPLSVIKTRQMASHSSQGIRTTVSNIWKNEGVPGFYRGFATVIFGTIPARMVYLAALEVVKDGTTKLGHRMQLAPTTTAGLANFAGGAAASLSIQLVTVPIDVVSQRQMVHGTDTSSRPVSSSRAASSSRTVSSSPAQPRSQSHSTAPGEHRQYHSTSTASVSRSQAGGGQLGKGITRGFGMSVATFVPSSAMWWAAYGVYQRVVSQAYLNYTSSPQTAVAHSRSEHSTGAAYALDTAHHSSAATAAVQAPASRALTRQEVLTLQLTSSLLAGATASLLTNPLDLIKTRIQVAVKGENQAASVRAVLEEILREDGPAGLLRGALPRMVNSAMWGSCMVMVYEFLKRISMKDE